MKNIPYLLTIIILWLASSCSKNENFTLEGKIENLPRFFSHLDKILSDNGKVFFDSSDLCYLYENEEGFIELPEGDNYYGELTYKMQFKNIMGEEFPWLYIDIDTLRNVALKYGYAVEVIEDGEYYNYLAQIKKIR